VLDFSSMDATFSDFVDDKTARQFAERTKLYAAMWSCYVGRDGKSRHRVPYDMWWNRIPHKDAQGRLWKTEWTLVQPSDV
jgi:hypothetical protein